MVVIGVNDGMVVVVIEMVDMEGATGGFSE